MKLFVSLYGSQIKIEVNQAFRGILHHTRKRILCEKAQRKFDAFCFIDVVSLGQLYGGKICAALDRQHPRDLFDIKHFLAVYEFNDEIKQGFILSLISSNRPIIELLFPNFIDQNDTIINQFQGMTDEEFTYQQFLTTRTQLVEIIQSKLTKEDKVFIFSFESLVPQWEIYDFEKFPSIQWKLKNILKLKKINTNKYNDNLEQLRNKLDL